MTLTTLRFTRLVALTLGVTTVLIGNLAGAAKPGRILAKMAAPQALGAFGSRPAVQCVPPTLAQCRDPQYAATRCGKLAMAAARTNPTSACNTLLGADAITLADSLPTRRVIAPLLTTASGATVAATAQQFGDCMPGAPGRSCARLPDYSYNGHTYAGLSNSPMGDVMARMAYYPPSNISPAATFFRWADASRRIAWDNNGYAVNTCREYIWEKYYDYSLFEAGAATNSNDPRALVNIAYGGPDGPQSIGSRAVLGIPLSQKDGTPTGVNIGFPTSPQVKNTFYTAKLADDVPEMVAVDCYQRNAVAPFAIVLNDTDLYNTLVNGPKHIENFAWHQAMNEHLRDAGYLDEELYRLEDVRRQFEGLLARRLSLTKQWEAYLRALIDESQEKESASATPFDDIYDPATWDQYAISAASQGYDLPAAGEAIAINAGLALIPAPDFSDMTIIPPGELQIAADALIGAMCEGESIGAFSGFYIAFAAIDNQIEAALHRAQDLGCLDNNNPYSPCDWSPNLFAQRVTDQFGAERERDYKTCLAYTKNDFSKLNPHEFRVSTTEVVPTCEMQDFRSNPTQVEHYAWCVDEWIRRVFEAIVAATGQSPVDPATGLLRVGKNIADSESVGGSMAKATLSYKNAFLVTGFEPPHVDPADLALSTEGEMNATASLFNSLSAKLVDGKFKMTNQQVDVDFSVFDQVVYADAIEGYFSGDTLSSINDQQAHNATFVEAFTVVPVLGIPLTVRGSVTGQVGLAYTASAVSNHATSTNQLVAVVTPFMGVDANASVSIDLAIIEAGVKGSIAVVHLENPISTGLTVARTQPGIQDPFLVVQAGSNITLTTLSGYIAAFGEIDLGFWSESAEVRIASWNGLSSKSTLYNVDFDVNAAALFTAAQMGKTY